MDGRVILKRHASLFLPPSPSSGSGEIMIVTYFIIIIIIIVIIIKHATLALALRSVIVFF
jgi:hypothetical protein